jgi:MFS family permease
LDDSRNHARSSEKTQIIVCVVLTVLAILRIVAAYPSISVAYDEPAHIACGMEWLDKGTFHLEPLHPPLARIAAAIGPYLAGARLPHVGRVSDASGTSFDIYPAGNDILYTNDHFNRNLALARLGEIPFFLVGATLIFFWTRSLYGAWPAVAGVSFYTTLPAVLAFAGLAFVDFALSVFLPCTLFLFVRWLELPNWKRAACLGASAGLAVLSNLSALFFTPICGVAILIGWFCRARERSSWRTYLSTAVIAALLSSLVIWAGYRFSMTPLNEAFARPVQDLSQLPSPLRPVARAIIKINPPVPAPDFFRGILASWAQNKKSPPSYVLGEVRRGGFWYFYWLVLGLKTPLPFLIVALIGIFASLRSNKPWQNMAPALSAIAILLVSMVVKVDFGIRHILFIYVFLTVAAAGAVFLLWQSRTSYPKIVSAGVTGLLLCQLVSSISAHPDYIAYFNLLGGKHPEERLLFGCDLDCGQDLEKLAQALQARRISHVTLQLWTSADLHRSNLPPFDTLEAYKPASGWIAISVLYLRSGHGIFDATATDAYAWLNQYRPEDHIGKTILLYNIPANNTPASATSQPR